MARIIKKEEVGRGLFVLDVADAAWKGIDIRPGQFGHVKVPDDSRLLRRPIGVLDFDSEAGVVSLVIQRAGRGTHQIGALQAGENIDIMLPLGNFFDREGAENIIIVTGGVGGAPMLYCEKYYRGQADIRMLMGFASAEEIFRESPGALICTEDGSRGERGFVTALLEKEIVRDRPDAIWACGPTPMMAAVQTIAEKNGIPCKISAEQRMGCGVGACLCCSVLGKDGQYRCACADGPVFNVEEVIIGD